MNYRLFAIGSGILIALLLACSANENKQHLEAVAQLRLVVKHDLYLEYMHTDDYLLKWLQASDMNAKRAADALRKALNWRKQKGIDSILDDKSLNCDTDFPVITSALTKNGQPVLVQHVGQWNIRKHVLAGKTDRFVICATRALELMADKVRRQHQERGNVTTYIMLINLRGYNLRQHGCLLCIPALVTTMTTYDQFYPGMVDKFFLVNTPSAIETLLSAVKAVVSKRTGDALKVFGYEKNKWSHELLELISKERLPV